MNGSAARDATCGQCDSVLAGGDEEIEVDGSRRHRFSNQAGITFTIGCYRHAPGCVGSGPASDEDTWFAGHTWQRAFCRSCGAHAGWLFRGRARVFFGLHHMLIGVLSGVMFTTGGAVAVGVAGAPFAGCWWAKPGDA